MQAEAGYFSLTGEPGTPPARFGLSIVDLMTGLGLAYALLAALTAARATGVGRDIDVSLFDMALHNTCYLATWYLNEGVVTGRLPRSAHPSLTPCQLYRTRDGWIYLMCNKEKFWPALCEKLGRPEWGEDDALPPVPRPAAAPRPADRNARPASWSSARRASGSRSSPAPCRRRRSTISRKRSRIRS